MACKCREEIVGKRFLSVRGSGKLKLNKISEWEWRSGVVRAISAKDTSRVDLTVLVEFDDTDWQRREWIRIHHIFQLFLVEHTLVWCERSDRETLRQTIDWPALNFRSIVDKVGLSSIRRRPIEFLGNKQLSFVEDRNLKGFQEGEENTHSTVRLYPNVGQAIKDWLDYQDGQKILLTTPTVLVGYRLEVYRAEGTTQWYTAVIQSYNHTTKTLSVTDDTVLEEHNEDPALIQMRLIDDGVVDSILRGVEIGIGPRRTRQTNKDKDQTSVTRNSQQATLNKTPLRSGKTCPKEIPNIGTPESDKEKCNVKTKNSRERKRKPNEPIENPSPQSPNYSKRSRSVENKKSNLKVENKQDSAKAVKNNPETDKSANSVSPRKRDTKNRDRCKTQVKDVKKEEIQNKQTSRRDRSVKNNKIVGREQNQRVKRDRSVESSKDTKSDSKTDSEEEEEDIPSEIPEEKSSSPKNATCSDNTNCESEHKESANSVNNEISCDTSEDSNKSQEWTSEIIASSEEQDKQQGSDCDSNDNMHLFKQRLLASNNNNTSQSLAANIDVNQSVTDQITKLVKTERISASNEDEKTLPSSQKSVSPKSASNSSYDLHSESKELRNSNFSEQNVTLPGSNFIHSNLHSDDHRSSSRASDHSNSGYSDERRPGSRLDDLKSSSKNSPASSPLIIDKAEPVNPYRDPELMRKNPVQSNVHGMLGHQPKSSTYPNVHTPIPSAPPPGSLPTTTSYPTSHQIPRSHVLPALHYPHHQMPGLGPAALSQLGIHPTLGQLDQTSLAALQQQQQQISAMQYNLLLSRGYPSTPANLTLLQLEHLWQQKYPSVPIPPQWMLAKNQEDLVGHLFPLKDREIIERERERMELERIERDKMERERQIDRERQERIEREREREKMEREREMRERAAAEKERLEKEKIERERKEREEWKRMEHEREQKKERERILKESADTLAAVDDHFERSLRNKQMEAAVAGAMWPSPSITLGTGKGMMPKMEPSQQRKHESSQSLEDKFNQEQEMRQRQMEEILRRQQEEQREKMFKQFESQQKLLAEHQKNEIKSEKMTKSCSGNESKSQAPGQGLYKGYLQQGSNSSAPTKQEPNFSLYGYQPFQLSFISSDQLHLHGLDKKEEKVNIDSKQSLQSATNMGRSSPKRTNVSVPPPLIKDSNPHSSVIVDNRSKDVSKSASPRPAHSHHNSNMSLSSSSPRSQPQPAHTPSRHHNSPHQEQSMDLSSSTGLPVSTHSAFRATDGKHIKHTQSPLRVASPHQLNAAIMQQPVNYHRNSDMKVRTSPSSKSPVSSSDRNSGSSNYMSAAIAQPPVSLPPGSVNYSCSLIQQGLVPNPIYSQNTVKSVVEQHSSAAGGVPVTSNHSASGSLTTHSIAATSSQSTHSVSSHGVKRKSNKEGSSRKRQKSESLSSNSSSGIKIPVTTPQIMTNHSPYTTTNSTSVTTSSILSAVSTTSVTSTSVTSSSPALSSSSSFTSSANMPVHGSSGYMDSFKSFVENAVQNAFFQDQTQSTSQSQQQQPQQQQMQQPQLQQRIKSEPLQMSSSSLPAEEASSLTLSSSNSSLSSQNAVMDTINRVANGQIDTDSDTLSAPSPPPPHFKDNNTSSPHKSANHPKLKKAWLQRHSDEDKESKNSPVPQGETDTSSKAEIVKTCYVNLSYISPSKEGGTKSPISALKLPNGNIKDINRDDESTTSASETETQIADISTGKKRAKTKRNSANSNKKIKCDSDDSSSTSSKKKNSKKSKESKENSNKTASSKTKESSEDEKSEKSKKTEDENLPKKEKVKETKSNPEPQQQQQQPQQSGEVEKLPPIDKQEKNAENVAKSEKKKHKKVKDIVKLEQNQTQQNPQQHKQQQGPLSNQQNTNASSFNKPLVTATMSTLKKTCEPFLQDGSCSEVTPKLMKCRECKMTPTQRSKKLPNIFCRFYAFRRLRYSQKGFLTIAGFSELTDAENDDIEPWLPRTPVMEPRIDIETSKYVVAKVGDKFCELVQQEMEAKTLAGEDAKIAWKRAVTGVREMCDVCDTTLFNMHWVCHKCGFVVCLDCYKVKLKALRQQSGEEEEDPFTTELIEEQREWLTCSANRQQHEPDKLMLTQIIPRDALWEVGKLIHDMKKKWNIQTKCTCGQSNSKLMQKNGLNQYVQQALNHLTNNKNNKKMLNGIGEDHKMYKGKKDSQAINGNVKYNPDSSSPLSLLADVASMDSESSRDRSESPYGKGADKYGKSYNPITEPVSPCGGGNNSGEGDNEKKNPASCSTLRELLTKTAGKVKGNENNKKTSKPKSASSTLDDIIQSVVEKQLPKDMENSQPIKLMHYIPRFGHSGMLTRDVPILVHSLTETSVLYPDVPHSWLCDGRLLRLHDPKHKGNFKIFQEQWKRGQPVLVSGVDKQLNKNLWHPQAFSKQFGREKNDLVNCSTGVIIIGHPMSVFWDGFEKLEERLVDDDEEPMLLKLKDWPPGDDFSDIMPNYFDDLMQSLPLPEYTHRHGKLNLASRLPDFLVRPDLGPKMYNAYGSASCPNDGTTNLHLDVSDAVNVMVYVGIPADGPRGKQVHVNTALKAIDDAGCDIITKRRVRETNEVPGALWHIYDAMDADKIRDFLNKVGKERGEEIEPHHDPIHDQSWYLDVELRERLYKEYGVLGYTIIQCMGDAVFIPAGSPHQVKNLHSCIKVAEDFVSPEHLNHCFTLTQEFRTLSDTHSNHEDKLQVKNIIYHAVKDALAVLNEAEDD